MKYNIKSNKELTYDYLEELRLFNFVKFSGIKLRLFAVKFNLIKFERKF